MNVTSVKIPEKRFDSPIIQQLEIQAFGADNLYPQRLKNIVACSPTASSCMERYISFIQGDGFKNIVFSETEINRLGETTDDILQLISSDTASFYGLALHVNYNVLGEIVEVFHVPFENCRLTEENEKGIVEKIAVHPDWTGKLRRNGKNVRVDKKNVDYIDVFNPDKAVVLRQIELAGGIEKYKGQILYISNCGKQTYPLPKYDSVVTQMSIEEGLSNISYKNTRCSLHPQSILVTKKGQNTVSNNVEGVLKNSGANDIFEQIATHQSDRAAGNIMHIEIESEAEVPQFIRMQSQNYDKEFTVTTNQAEMKIYSAFGQEVFYRIKTGSIGFSSGLIEQAYEYYSSLTNNERRMIERAFDKIFKHFPKIAMLHSDFSIQPLKYISVNANNG